MKERKVVVNGNSRRAQLTWQSLSSRQPTRRHMLPPVTVVMVLLVVTDNIILGSTLAGTQFNALPLQAIPVFDETSQVCGECESREQIMGQPARAGKA
jgi:hypothetical protein